MTRALTDAEIATLLRAGHESFGPESLELLTRLVADYAARGLIVESLAERVHKQSELLSKRAEVTEDHTPRERRKGT